MGRSVEASRDALGQVFAYHERTKHFPHRYARALGYMDWDTQPNPFRRYEGASLIQLPIPGNDHTRGYDDLFALKSVTPRSMTRESISEFLYYSLAISAWKSFRGSTWSLRVNPSSGNLHPTEAYLIAGPNAGLCERPGLYHYAPEIHSLELRGDLGGASTPSGPLPGAGVFLVGLSSVHWRESWKYGERAYRYCQHDMGHAIAALRISAAVQGWTMRLLDAMDDARISRWLGLDRYEEFHPAEREEPAALALVSTPEGMWTEGKISEIERGVDEARWFGRANGLSADHHPWPVIDEVWGACLRRDSSTLGRAVKLPDDARMTANRDLSAGQVLRRRRSAVAMDGSTRLTAAEFFLMLDRVVPRRDVPPWDALPWPPAVDLVLFVHRVDGLPSGLYCLVRDADRVDALKKSLSAEFQWTRAPGSPIDLPLYLLEEGDVRSDAAGVSCGQDIAADGAFAAAMLADFENPIRERGAWFYRRLHWEAGAVGQVLYLEAEAAGVQATGIGCFFDDALHELIGIEDRRFQTIYHFTVGGAVDDPRLTTLPAYPTPGSAPFKGPT